MLLFDLTVKKCQQFWQYYEKPFKCFRLIWWRFSHLSLNRQIRWSYKWWKYQLQLKCLIEEFAVFVLPFNRILLMIYSIVASCLTLPYLCYKFVSCNICDPLKFEAFVSKEFFSEFFSLAMTNSNRKTIWLKNSPADKNLRCEWCEFFFRTIQFVLKITSENGREIVSK